MHDPYMMLSVYRKHSHTYDALSRPVARNSDAFAYNDRGEVSSATISGNADTSGNVVAEYAYDAFGKTIAQTGSMSDMFRHR